MKPERKRNPQEKNKEMKFEGNSEVIKNILLKKKLMDAGDPAHEKIRPLLYICGGGMRGAYGGGEVIALEKAGLSGVFDVVIGNSTGAPTAAYFLAGQSEIGTSIYYQECTTSKFISISRLLRGRRVMDVKYLANIFRDDEKKKLSQDAVRSNRSVFYVVTTNLKTGESVFLDAKALPDIVDGLEASVSVPGLSNGETKIDDSVHFDGGSAPLPLLELIKKFNPTDILILGNRPEKEDFMGYLSEAFLLPLLYQHMPVPAKRAFKKNRRNALMQKGIALSRTERRANVATIWAPDAGALSALSQDADRLQEASELAEKHLTKILQNEAILLPREPRGSILQTT